jgi:excinuclease ABC A subunit
MAMDKIKITGAREHNLKNIDLEIPRNKLTCLVGVSGSGKSTIAFDIIFSEGQRQYLESLGTYAARLLPRTEKPEVDRIKGLSSTVLIEQKRLRGSQRSTVGTTTELYTYLRLLFSRAGGSGLSAAHFSFNNASGACKQCKGIGVEITINPDSLLDYEKTINEGGIKSSNYKPGSRYFNILKTTDRLNFDKPIKNFTKEELDFLLYSPHITLKNNDQGFVQSYSWEGIINRGIKRASDLRGISDSKSKHEAGYWISRPCTLCHGGRLNEQALSVRINGKNIGEYANLPITNLIEEIRKIDNSIAKPIVKRMCEILQSLIDIGIGYVSLNRSIDTLSGGEAQRIKLARELGSDLIEVIYVLDEPTAGLHPRDTKKLITTLKKLRDDQNTLIVVEHDLETMLASDYIVEVGPKAGRFGGEIISTGTPQEIINDEKSLTGKYLGKRNNLVIRNYRREPKDYLLVENANLHNLKNLSVKIPTGVFAAVTGVSGSGKSSLINDVFVNKFSDKVVFVDQSSVGATVRGNIATYSGVFDLIRELIAKENNVNKALFSSNSKGACPDCEGLGYHKVDMHFMADVKTICESCEGKKYTAEALKYKLYGKNIYEILEMTVEETAVFFTQEELNRRLNLLADVGLGYLNLGQTLDTLSGGESQRLKLASNLHKKGEFYVLDEPTSGLHFVDIEKLLALLHTLVDNGNSVLVIEHNLDVIRSADWIIDLGPEGGDKGGRVIAEGTPEKIMEVENSYTGQYLKAANRS